jgi:pyruvate/2-oxoglutarate dehydrogenase complex dihydrolipoamide dehydrogenase (E3) component
VPGLDDPRCWTSDTVLDAEELPGSMIVLGAGPVALELATYANDLETAVTIIQRSPQVLRGTDEDAAAALTGGLRDAGMTVHLGTRLLDIRHTEAGTAVVRFEKDGAEHVVEAARVLNALGRQPSLRGLEASGVEIRKGAVAVAATQQTSQPHIFAAGDVCGPFEVVHVAIQQGEIAARNAARFLKGEGTGAWERVDYRLKLFAVFSDPQFATVGASEAELAAAGRAFRKASYPFADHGKSLVMGETHGLVKLLTDAASGEILGGTVVGPEASELIHEVAVAMHFRATAADLAAVPHYHPTLSEIWTYPAEELANPED